MTDPNENIPPNVIQLEAFWPYKVTVLAHAIRRQTGRVLREHGTVNLAQWRVLAALGNQDGRTAAEVVAITPMDKGIVSRATASLVQAGLVRKRQNPSDKRASALFLTAKGRKQFAQISSKLSSFYEQTIMPSPHKDPKNLIKQLQTLIDALQKDCD